MRVYKKITPIALVMVMLFSISTYTASAYALNLSDMGMVSSAYNWYNSRTEFLQIFLNRRNSPSPNLIVDGKGGPNTTAATKVFQSNNGLTPDGICGEYTWKKVYACLSDRGTRDAYTFFSTYLNDSGIIAARYYSGGTYQWCFASPSDVVLMSNPPKRMIGTVYTNQPIQ